MSFLAPILKMMAARANHRFQKQQQQQPQMMPKIVPKIMVARLPLSPMSAGPFGPRPFSGPMGPISPPRDHHIVRSNEMPEPEQPRREIRVIQRSKPEMRIIQGKIRPNIIPFPFLPRAHMKPHMIEEHEAEHL